MRSVGIVIGVLALAAAVRLSAQEPAKPGPEQEHFKQFEGTWDATVHFKGETSKGTMSWKVGLGGLWLLEHFKGEFAGSGFEGIGATSYDPAKKKYVNVWIDSMSTSAMTSEGTFDKAKKTMTMHGSMPTPDGKTMKTTSVTEVKDANNLVFTMSGPGPDGKNAELFKITYKRKTK
ncbi:MAG: DUF1579 domain-containing protein [Gemmataceae bacterium]|nr:DUF1579 domain-containing protein [Gemmataceae bacterium]MCI0737597.1 DUF1579 domain-containing protein [Gemmataceae bacterium]